MTNCACTHYHFHNLHEDNRWLERVKSQEDANPCHSCDHGAMVKCSFQCNFQDKGLHDKAISILNNCPFASFGFASPRGLPRLLLLYNPNQPRFSHALE